MRRNMTKTWVLLLVFSFCFFLFTSCGKTYEYSARNRYYVYGDLIFTVPQPEKTNDDFNKGLIHLQEGRVIDAYKEFSTIHQNTEGSEKAYALNLMAICKGVQGEFDESMALFDRSAEFLFEMYGVYDIDANMILLNQAGIAGMFKNNNLSNLLVLEVTSNNNANYNKKELDYSVVNFYKKLFTLNSSEKDLKNINSDFKKAEKNFIKAYGEDDLCSKAFENQEYLYKKFALLTGSYLESDVIELMGFYEQKMEIIKTEYGIEHPEYNVCLLENISLYKYLPLPTYRIQFQKKN